MKRISLPGWAFVIATFCNPALALDSDSSQPMYIESDTAVHDDAKGETTYSGNVKTTQGSLEVHADLMTVYQKNGRTEKIIATGNPVRIKQTPEGGKEDMHGTSQRADYFPDSAILILLENATVWQGEKKDTSDRVASDRIEYDTRRSLMRAGASGGGGKRVHVTLQPSKGQEQSER
jgi:lipopolysaccharide export system protein LptA